MNPEELNRIRSQAEGISRNIGTLASAESLGLKINPQTTVEQAENVVRNSAVNSTDALRRGMQEDGVPTAIATKAETPDQFKEIRESFKATNDLAQKILALQTPKPEEEELAKQELGLRQSIEEMAERVPERGLAGSGMTLESLMSEVNAITGGRTRESLIATRKLRQIQEQLNLARGNKETQLNVLKTAYDVTRQSASDALEFYKLTAPDRIGFDAETGQVYFHNPVTNEVYASDAKGFKPKNKFVEELRKKYPDAGITPQDTETQATAKLPKSKLYQKDIKESGGTGLLSTVQGFDRERALANDFEKYASDARVASRNINVIQQAFKSFEQNLKEGEPLGAQSQAVITAFNKITDPSSVVRESEYARTPEGASLINRLEGYALKISQGGAGLELEELTNIRDTALALYDGFEEQMVDFATRTANQAGQLQIITGGQFGDLDRILTPDVKQLLESAKNREFTPPPELEEIEVDKDEGGGLLYGFWEGLKDAFK